MTSEQIKNNYIKFYYKRDNIHWEYNSYDNNIDDCYYLLENIYKENRIYLEIILIIDE